MRTLIWDWANDNIILMGEDRNPQVYGEGDELIQGYVHDESEPPLVVLDMDTAKQPLNIGYFVKLWNAQFPNHKIELEDLLLESNGEHRKVANEDQRKNREQRELDYWNQDNTDEPGTEWLPIEEFEGMDDLYRMPGAEHSLGAEYWEKLKAHIQEHGITNPLRIAYNPDTDHAYVGEGNHRLQIARELGLTHLPAVSYRDRGESKVGPGRKMDSPLKPNEHKYFPGSFRPSEIGFKTRQSSSRRSNKIIESFQEACLTLVEQGIEYQLRNPKNTINFWGWQIANQIGYSIADGGDAISEKICQEAIQAGYLTPDDYHPSVPEKGVAMALANWSRSSEALHVAENYLARAKRKGEEPRDERGRLKWSAAEPWSWETFTDVEKKFLIDIYTEVMDGRVVPKANELFRNGTINRHIEYYYNEAFWASRQGDFELAKEILEVPIYGKPYPMREVQKADVLPEYPEEEALKLIDDENKTIKDINRLDRLDKNKKIINEAPRDERGRLKWSNILDPIHDSLDQQVFNGDEPKEQIFFMHLHHVSEVMKQSGFNPHAFEFFLTGSLCTYQYSDTSDVDISIVPIAELEEEDRADLIQIVVNNLDGSYFSNTNHKYQHFVHPEGVDVEDIFALGMRAAWDFKRHRWVAPPKRESSLDVRKKHPDWVAKAILVSDKINSLIDANKYEEALETYKEVHDRRKRDQINIGDVSLGNIVYKFLNNNGTFDRLRNIGARIAKIASTIPLSPGETPIPDGHFRLYHYTQGSTPEEKEENLESIRQNGIQYNKARGDIYGEPSGVWASAQVPSSDAHFVEFHVPRDFSGWVVGDPWHPSNTPEEYTQKGTNVAFANDIPPENIVAVHHPWHDRYRYIKENYGDDLSSLEWVYGDPSMKDYARALDVLKAERRIAKTSSDFVGDTWVTRPQSFSTNISTSDFKLIVDGYNLLKMEELEQAEATLMAAYWNIDKMTDIFFDDWALRSYEKQLWDCIEVVKANNQDVKDGILTREVAAYNSMKDIEAFLPAWSHMYNVLNNTERDIDVDLQKPRFNDKGEVTSPNDIKNKWNVGERENGRLKWRESTRNWERDWYIGFYNIPKLKGLLEEVTEALDRNEKQKWKREDHNIIFEIVSPYSKTLPPEAIQYWVGELWPDIAQWDIDPKNPNILSDAVGHWVYNHKPRKFENIDTLLAGETPHDPLKEPNSMGRTKEDIYNENEVGKRDSDGRLKWRESSIEDRDSDILAALGEIQSYFEDIKDSSNPNPGWVEIINEWLDHAFNLADGDGFIRDVISDIKNRLNGGDVGTAYQKYIYLYKKLEGGFDSKGDEEYNLQRREDIRKQHGVGERDEQGRLKWSVVKWSVPPAEQAPEYAKGWEEALVPDGVRLPTPLRGYKWQLNPQALEKLYSHPQWPLNKKVTVRTYNPSHFPNFQAMEHWFGMPLGQSGKEYNESTGQEQGGDDDIFLHPFIDAETANFALWHELQHQFQQQEGRNVDFKDEAQRQEYVENYKNHPVENDANAFAAYMAHRYPLITESDPHHNWTWVPKAVKSRGRYDSRARDYVLPDFEAERLFGGSHNLINKHVGPAMKSLREKFQTTGRKWSINWADASNPHADNIDKQNVSDATYFEEPKETSPAGNRRRWQEEKGFQEEKEEHGNAFSDEQIWQIVQDHLNNDPEYYAKESKIDSTKVIFKEYGDAVDRYQYQGTIIAYIDEQPVGAIIIDIFNHPNYDKKATINHIQVVPQWRRQGIATLLYNKGKEWAAAQGYERLEHTWLTEEGAQWQQSLSSWKAAPIWKQASLENYILKKFEGPQNDHSAKGGHRLTIHHPETGEQVGEISYTREGWGPDVYTYVDYLGYSFPDGRMSIDLHYPDPEYQERNEMLRKTHPALGQEMLRWLNQNVGGPYKADVVNPKLRQTLERNRHRIPIMSLGKWSVDGKDS